MTGCELRRIFAVDLQEVRIEGLVPQCGILVIRKGELHDIVVRVENNEKRCILTSLFEPCRLSSSIEQRESHR